MRPIADILHDLTQPLDPSRVSQRSAGQGRSLSYLEAFDVINTANRIFGPLGWSMTTRDITPIGAGQFYAVVSVTVFPTDAPIIERSGTGFGAVGNQTGDDAVDKAVKAAESDAMKRAFRTFGDQFGNGLYDKDSDIHKQAQQAGTPFRTNGNAAGNVQPQRPVSSNQPMNGGAACPKCGGAMWDNRATKTNPRQPDFKCKDRGCDGVIWPPKHSMNPEDTDDVPF